VTAEGFARVLKALLPPSKAWKIGPDHVISRLFLAAGDEFARVQGRALDMVEEADPRTTEELLPEFEAVFLLSPDGTLEERRARVVSNLLRRQRYRPVDFQTTLAAVLGQDAEDVVVLERDRAFAILVDDDREIFRFFIYRDPGLPGTYDVGAAQAIVDSVKPAHTAGYVIESVDFLCDDPFSLCDRDLLGSPSVPSDGGGIFVPGSAADFALLGEAAPQSLWLCQEASGNLADSIGALPLTPLNGPSYQQAVAGWTRLGAAIADVTTQRFVLQSGVGPNPGTTSQLWIAYIDVTATPGATRRLWGLGGTTPCDARITNAPVCRLTVDAASADGTANPVGGGVRPYVVLYDRTNSRAVLYTDQEKIVGTYAAGVNDGNKGLGPATGPSAAMVWACLFTGAAAEKSDAQVKSLLQALGWAVPWT
jgi:hypothetical protein